MCTATLRKFHNIADPALVRKKSYAENLMRGIQSSPNRNAVKTCFFDYMEKTLILASDDKAEKIAKFLAISFRFCVMKMNSMSRIMPFSHENPGCRSFVHSGSSSVDSSSFLRRNQERT